MSAYAPTYSADIATAPPERTDSDELREFLATATERFNGINMSEPENTWRTRAVEEFDFLALNHWPKQIRQQLESGDNPQPCLSFDRISPSIKRVENAVRMSPPSVKLSPLGTGYTKKEAEIEQGLLRHIDVDSRAEIPQEVALRHMLTCGRGWFRVNTAWESDDDSDPEAMYRQKLVIEGFPSPFAVYPDPADMSFDGRDMMYAFIPQRMTRSNYRATYPKSQLASLSSFTGIGDDVQRWWFPDGEIIVAEYYYVECDYEDRTRELLKIQGDQPGTAFWVDRTKIDPAMYAGRILDVHQDRRKIEKRSVKWAKINAVEKLEESDWLGQWIPLIPVYGDDMIENGKILKRGMVRPAMSGNLMYDFFASKFTAQVGLSPVSPIIAAVGQIEGLEHIWNTANRIPRAVLPYRPIDVNGTMVPMPARSPASPDVAASAEGMALASEEVKQALDTYAPSLGAPGQEKSGKAILAQQNAGDIGHYNYTDNYARAIMRKTEIELDLIPKIYNEPDRILHIIDPDGTSDTVLGNPSQFAEGMEKILRTDIKCDFTVNNAPTFQTQRQEQRAALIDLSGKFPQMAQALDLLIKLYDLPGTLGDQIADRVRPPNVQSQQDGQPPLPQEIVTRVQQDQQMIQMLSREVGTLSDIIKEKRLELGSSEREAIIKAAATIAVAELKTGTDQGIAMLKAEMEAHFNTLLGSPQTANPGAESAPAPPNGVPAPQVAPGPMAGAPQ